jgi:hypothetical protein
MTADGGGVAGLALILRARPDKVAMRCRHHFLLDLVMINHSAVPVDLGTGDPQLMINGEESFFFALRIGNGIRPVAVAPLNPGERRTTTWEDLGRGLFERPGDYTLVLSLGDLSAPPIVVRVHRL